MGRGFAKPKVKDRFDLQPFLMRKLPVFWVMGPRGTGKKTLACMLAKCSKYNLVTISELVIEEQNKGKFRAKIIEECRKKNKLIPDEIIIMLIKEYIFLNYSNSRGFIFCGFPLHLRQAKLFEFEICQVNMIVYCTLLLDSLLGRMITKYGEINSEKVRRTYVTGCQLCQQLYKNYASKMIKIMTNYPPEETVTKLVADLEDYWGYKFDRLYTKN